MSDLSHAAVLQLDYARGALVSPFRVWSVTSAGCGLAALGVYMASYFIETNSLQLLIIALAGVAAAAGLLGLLHGRSRVYRYGILLSLVGMALSATAATLPSPHRHSRCGSVRLSCASNLKQIGNAVLLYGNDHNGRMPPGIAGLLEEDITVSVLICPASNDTPARNPTTQPTEADVLTGGHLSYIYLGAGFSYPPPVSAVIAYEPLSNHQGAGMNVLFGDLHVEFFQTAAANKILAELSAGHNPPRPETFK